MNIRIAALVVCLFPLAVGHSVAAEPAKLMFVDTGNTGRSVTAEALANVMIAAQHLPVLVISRAVDLNPYNVIPEAGAASLLAQRGIDVSAHRAAQLTANDVRHSDLILTMTAKHKDTIIAAFPEAKAKAFTISEYTIGQASDVVDAFGQPMAVYEQVLSELDRYVPLALGKAAKREFAP
jgi:protein-tyrosine phosphatase